MRGASLFLVLVAFGCAQAFSPPILLPELSVDPEDVETAIRILPKLAPFFGAGSNCRLFLDNIHESRSYVSDDISHKVMELKLSSDCNPGSEICSGIHVQMPLGCDACEELVDVSKIQCFPDIIVDPDFMLGGFREIERPSSDPIVLKVAQEATKFLYGHFSTATPCPLHLKEIVRARQQAVMGFNYEFDLEVETIGANFNCEYALKLCKNVKMHEPFAEHCPHGEPSCVIPVALDDVACMDSNMPIVGGYGHHEINEEILGIAQDIAPKLVDSSGLPHSGCSLRVERVLKARSQVVAGTNFLLDIEFTTTGPNCPQESKVCRNVKIFRALPFNCGESGCLSLSSTADIQCTSPHGTTTNMHETIAEEAVKFLYHLFDVERPCLVELTGHSVSTNDNIQFDVELSVQTKEGQEGCDFVKQACKNIHLRKLTNATCPYNTRPCLVPVRLHEAECVNDF
eukprot:TRINITY_DN1026_c0_g1_i1.p1 TRINITY_DN1026_c0_g1~~TRINITY_DN1026_c0_g1_i1.p1  ORF type:complete len:457 (+),score=70.77 TRINITY_DN1026_c0_g1_i1:217-1587(+)